MQTRASAYPSGHLSCLDLSRRASKWRNSTAFAVIALALTSAVTPLFEPEFRFEREFGRVHRPTAGETIVSLMSLLFVSTEPQIFPSAKELAILEVISSLEPNGSCCADVQREVRATLGREPRLASLYQLLKSLKSKGLIGEAETATSNGGRPRRVYRLTSRGREILSMSRSLISDGKIKIPQTV
jgi:DNA-binding PadR family transcriptional regulator